MAGGLTLDTGALIAGDRGDRRFWVFWKRAIERGATCTVPGPALAQAWRGPSNARMAMVLAACRVEPLTPDLAKRTGELCGRTSTADIVDAAVVIGAASRGDVILTGDPGDLKRLAGTLSRPPRILPVNELA